MSKSMNNAKQETISGLISAAKRDIIGIVDTLDRIERDMGRHRSVDAQLVLHLAECTTKLIYRVGKINAPEAP